MLTTKPYTLLAIPLSLTLLSSPVWADGQAQAQAAAEAQEGLAYKTANELTRVAGALQNFYVTNLAWPANLQTQLTNYYTGNFSTPFGQITGTPLSGNGGYQLTISLSIVDANQKAALQSVLTQQGGGLSGNSIAMNIAPPQAAAAYTSMLSRLPDSTGNGLNTMQTNLELGGFDINDIGSINSNNVIANSATVSSMTVTEGDIDELASTNANITNATISNATIAVANITDANAVTLDVSNVINAPTANLSSVNSNVIESDLVIAASLKSHSGIIDIDSDVAMNGRLMANAVVVSGQVAIDESGKVYYQNQDIDDRYLGISDKAADSALLGGITPDKFARRDISNIFTQAQSFQDRLYANAGLYAGNNRVIDTSGALYYRGQNTDLRYLGVQATAYDADRLAGIDASKYARQDISNVFSEKQYFSKGLDINGGLTADNVNVTGRTNTRELYLNGWNVASAQTDIAALKSKDNHLQNQINDVKNSSVNWKQIGFTMTTNANEMDEWDFTLPSTAQEVYIRTSAGAYSVVLSGIVSIGWGGVPSTTLFRDNAMEGYAGSYRRYRRSGSIYRQATNHYRIRLYSDSVWGGPDTLYRVFYR